MFALLKPAFSVELEIEHSGELFPIDNLTSKTTHKTTNETRISNGKDVLHNLQVQPSMDSRNLKPTNDITINLTPDSNTTNIFHKEEITNNAAIQQHSLPESTTEHYAKTKHPTIKYEQPAPYPLSTGKEQPILSKYENANTCH
uniref:Uncharacterized protein n=1 Tax=Solanum tuberosum TaxID=4113 RepID=M1DWR8_SOLTU